MNDAYSKKIQSLLLMKTQNITLYNDLNVVHLSRGIDVLSYLGHSLLYVNIAETLRAFKYHKVYKGVIMSYNQIY